MPNSRSSDSAGAARPPWWCRLTLALAAWLVPARLRPEWRQRWQTAARNWWTLVERGEVTTRTTARFCATALGDAFWRRIRKEEWRQWFRGPSFVLACIAAAFLLLALVSRGFAVTQSLLAILDRPTMTYVYRRPYDAAGDRLVAYLFPIFTAMAGGLGVAMAARSRVHPFGWRHWAFLLIKTAAAMTLLPLAFIELGYLFRSLFSSEGGRVLIGGLGPVFALIVGQGAAIYWCLSDQRRRCPVCLRLMTLPVAVGSWASMFDPATTELLCEEGHGALCVVESESGGADRWLKLGVSWQDLFEEEKKEKQA